MKGTTSQIIYAKGIIKEAYAALEKIEKTARFYSWTEEQLEKLPQAIAEARNQLDKVATIEDAKIIIDGRYRLDEAGLRKLVANIIKTI